MQQRAIGVITSLQVFVCVSVISGRMRVIARRWSIGVLIIKSVESRLQFSDKHVTTVSGLLDKFVYKLLHSFNRSKVKVIKVIKY